MRHIAISELRRRDRRHHLLPPARLARRCGAPRPAVVLRGSRPDRCLRVRGSRGAPESARCRRRCHSCRARRRGWMGAERSTRKTGHVRRAPRRRVGRHRWTFRDRLAQFLAGRALAVEERDLGLRNVTYGLFVDLGHAPTLEETAEAIGATASGAEGLAAPARGPRARPRLPARTRSGWRIRSRLSRLAYRVHAAGRWWYANCAWDASGSAPRSVRTVGSRRRARTAARRSTSRSRRTGPTTRACSSTASFPPRMVGRHRLHLKHDEPLPVGGAHRSLARRPRPGATIPVAKLAELAERGGATGSRPSGARTRASRTRRSSTGSGSPGTSGGWAD